MANRQWEENCRRLLEAKQSLPSTTAAMPTDHDPNRRGPAIQVYEREMTDEEKRRCEANRQEALRRQRVRAEEQKRKEQEQKGATSMAHHPTAASTSSSTNPTGVQLAPIFRPKAAAPPTVVKCQTVILSKTRFKVTTWPYSEQLVKVFKGIPASVYNDKAWTFPLSALLTLEEEVKQLPNVEWTHDASWAVKWLTTSPGADRGVQSPHSITESDLSSRIPADLFSKLYPYQIDAVKYGVERGGRFLLADDMGLGKTIQTLALCSYYENDFPLLITCPATVRSAWEEQIARFLTGRYDVQQILKQNDPMPQRDGGGKPLVVIVSYDLMTAKMNDFLKFGFGITVYDESHLLKEAKAQRTMAATKLANAARRVFLLSGTPALSRPRELFTQLKMIAPKIFSNFNYFAVRFCDGKQSKFGFVANGATNSTELTAVLQHQVMLRREKNDENVLNELPDKRREFHSLHSAAVASNLKQLQDMKKEYERTHSSDAQMTLYYETALAKANFVSEHVVNKFFYDGSVSAKVLIFAHHKIVLDEVAAALSKNKVRAIRIDGNTPTGQRGELVKQFQEDDVTRAAILSIGAANTGITLTAANAVVFAELTWNPADLFQAEDRCHRIGQKNSVIIHYLLVPGTADDYMLMKLKQKLSVLNSVNLSNESLRQNRRYGIPREEDEGERKKARLDDDANIKPVPPTPSGV